MGVMHSMCNSALNSHPTRGFCAVRQPDPLSAPYVVPSDNEGGGPSGHFSDFHGGMAVPALELKPGMKRATSILRINRWLQVNGYTHGPDCVTRHGGHANRRPGACSDATCPFGIMRADIFEQNAAALATRRGR
jgi:hypothetical protein|eukprot:5773527-Prymnesium_polylepis.2